MENKTKAVFLEQSRPLTINSVANSLIYNDKRKNLDDFFVWPPDLFALTSRIFSQTGIYKNVLIKSYSNKFNWPPEEINGVLLPKPWNEYVTETGQLWRTAIDSEQSGNPLNDDSNERLQIRGVLCMEGKSEDEQQKSVDETIGAMRLMDFNKFKFVKKLKLFLDANLEQEIFKLDEFELDIENEIPSPNSSEKYELFKALMTLHAIADEFASGFCIRSNKTLRLIHYKDYNGDTTKSLTFSERAAKTLLKHNRSISRINAEKCNILPKRQTPHTGITLRSISGNLAYHKSSVNVKWHFFAGKENRLFEKLKYPTVINTNDQKEVLSPLNILLIPWPFNISSKDIMPINLTKEDSIKRKYKYFKFKPIDPEEEQFKKALKGLLEKAKKENTDVDIVVLPETAIDHALAKILVTFCIAYDISGYVTGKQLFEPDRQADNDEKNNTAKLSCNYVQTQFFDYNDKVVSKVKDELRKLENYEGYKMSKKDYDDITANATRQDKHHRWKLSSAQIKRYNLGGSLSTNKNWWEGINIKKREINFFNLGEELSICSLICEDLARQDPISDLLRSVGPNLVFTLLMDGEQLKQRWSARYASILSDDPGSAVITLTSLGMINRHTESSKKSAKSIGLISDSKGNFTEVILPNAKCKGALVTLNLTPVHENLADRQNSFCYTNHLTLGGISYLEIDY